MFFLRTFSKEISFFFFPLREPQGIIACCNPVPPLVRQQVNELHLLVQQAREMPLLKVRKDCCWQWRCSAVFCLQYFSVYVKSLLTECALADEMLQCFLLFMQAEIAAQKKKGLTPVRKVGKRLLNQVHALNN